MKTQISLYPLAANVSYEENCTRLIESFRSNCSIIVEQDGPRYASCSQEYPDSVGCYVAMHPFLGAKNQRAELCVLTNA